MHHFPFHVSDYAAVTGHLSVVEDAAYRRALDRYYLKESPLEADLTKLARTLRLVGHESALQAVLEEFFILDGDCWRHHRCDSVIEGYRAMVEGGRKGGRASVERRSKGGSSQASTQGSSHRQARVGKGFKQPITNNDNHKPITKEERERASRAARGTRLPQDWALSDELRTWARSQRPDLDIDVTAAKFADHWHAKPGKDGAKLDWPATWRNWVRDEKGAAPRNGARLAPRHGTGETDYQRTMRERMEKVAPSVAAKAPSTRDFFEAEVTDVTPRPLG
jgi:uncharacterized protein YdaU (DUF1376 family)